MASPEKDAALAAGDAAASDAPTIDLPIGAPAFPTNHAEENLNDDTSLTPSSSSCPSPEDLQIEAPESQHDEAGRNKSNRGKNYSSREDENICKAWLIASQDPTTGTNQQTDRFFKRVTRHFNELNKPSTARSLESVKGRWRLIRRVCAKFMRFVVEVERNNPSGISKADKVQMAKEMWSKDDDYKPFLFEKCWRILKDSPKWRVDNGIFLANGAALGGHVGALVDRPCTRAMAAHVGTSAGGTVRPEGNKKAKLCRDSSTPSFETSSTNVETFGQESLKDREEKRKVREAKKAAFEAQRSFFENQKIEADRQREESDRRRVEEDRRRDEADRRREEADRRKEENDFLAIKVDGLDEESKIYIMEQKRDILARRKRSNPEVGQDTISTDAGTKFIQEKLEAVGFTALSFCEPQHKVAACFC